MNPLTERLDAPSAMQTLILANGVMGNRVVRLSEDSEFTRMAMKDVSFGELIEETFLRILSRPPAKGEAAAAAAFLGSSFPSRRVKTAKILHPRVFHGDHRVSWANHFDAESSRIRMAEERTLRIGDPPTQRLTKTFRERYEDLLWSLINAPEFILIP